MLDIAMRCCFAARSLALASALMAAGAATSAAAEAASAVTGAGLPDSRAEGGAPDGAAPAAAAPADAPDCFGSVARFAGVVAAVTGAVSVRLADGRELRLAGIVGPDLAASDAALAAGAVDPEARMRQVVADLTLSRAVSVAPIATAADRYGRIRAEITVAGTGLWLQRALVERGLALVAPLPDDHLCARRLQGFEAAARAEKAGFWADSTFSVLSSDAERLVESAARFVLVSGRVLSVGHAGRLHYLNFGRDFRSDFTVVLTDKDRAAFDAAGVGPDAVRGRIIRVRGVISDRDGGQISVAVPEAIEWVKEDP